jgi:hypothetical protein
MGRHKEKTSKRALQRLNALTRYFSHLKLCDYRDNVERKGITEQGALYRKIIDLLQEDFSDMEEAFFERAVKIDLSNKTSILRVYSLFEAVEALEQKVYEVATSQESQV